MPDVTPADLLAAYGGYPAYPDPSGGTIAPGDVLRAFGHVLAPGLVAPPAGLPTGATTVEQAFGEPRAKTARDYATELSAGRNKPPDPLETMLGVAGSPSGAPAMFIGPVGIRRLAAAGHPEYAQALAKAEQMQAAGAKPEEIYQATRIGEGPGISTQHGRLWAETPGLETGFQPEAQLPKIALGKGGIKALLGHFPTYEPSRVVKPGMVGGTVGDVWHDPMLFKAYPELGALPFHFKDPLPRPGYMNVGGMNYNVGEQSVSLNPKAFAPENMVEEMRQIMSHELMHGVQGIEKAPKGGNPRVQVVEEAAWSAIKQRQVALQEELQTLLKTPNPTDETRARARELTTQWVDLTKPEAVRAEQYKQYHNLAGEAQARNVSYRLDMTPAELAAKDPAVTQDVPYAEQLLRLGDWPTFPMPKARQPEQLKLDLSTAPSFSERMGEARDVAFQRAQRGQATGDYGLGLARRTAPEAPAGSFEDLAARQRAGFQGDKERILDEYRAATGQPRLGTERPLLAPGEEDIAFSMQKLPGSTVVSGQPDFGMINRSTRAANLNKQGWSVPGQPSWSELPPWAERPPQPSADVLLFRRPEEGTALHTVLRPDRPLFDLSPQGLARSHIQREQFDIPRTAAETVTPEYERATSKANIARVNREVAQGIKEHGLDWHAMGQLRDRYIAELGPEKGAAEFETYMREVGATSPNSNVEQNFRTASYYAQQRRAGEPLPKISYKRSTGNPYLPPREAPPTPYGNTAQGLHVMNLGLLERGEPYPLSRPKVPSFTENMLGNYRPVAVDRHNLRMWGIEAESPNVTGYKHLERTQQGEAEKMGIHPAQYQAAPWPFYAKSGADPALKLFQNRVMATAEAEGKTPAQVLRDFIRGTGKLLSVTPAAVLLGQSQDRNAPEPAR